MLAGHGDAAKAVPGQLPLSPVEWKTPSRTVPLVTPLGKLLHHRTILPVKNFFLKSKVNLPSCISGLSPLLVPSASTGRNLVLPSVQFPLSCCGQLLGHHRAAALPD